MQSQVLEQNDSQLKKRTWSSATDTMPDESPAKRPRLQDSAVYTTRRKLFVPGAGGQASPAVTVSDEVDLDNYHDIYVLIFTSLLYRSL